MSLWEILFLILLVLTLAVAGFAFYRWWKFKKMLSYTKHLIGKRVEDLVNLPNQKRVSIPVNIPKKGEVVIYFLGPNCKLCSKQKEEIKKLPKNLKIYEFDIRTKKGRLFAAIFRVSVLPTVVVLKNRTIVGYFTAFATSDKIVKVLKQN